MENVTEALYMAVAVIIFVLALGISILAFSNARSTSDIIIQYNDREYDYTYVNDNGGKTERIVSAESIIPTITRSYKENYRIIFYKDENKTPLEIYKNKLGETVNYIDLEKENLSGDEQRDKFIECLLYGKHIDEFSYKITGLQPNGLCGTILREGKLFKEYLGEYYQEDVEGTGDNVPTANKTKKRIISYVAQN